MVSQKRVQTYLEAPPLVNQINQDSLPLGVLKFEDLEQARPYLWKQVLRFNSIGYAGIANEKGQYLRIGWVNRLAGAEQPQLAQQLIPGGGDMILYNLDGDGNPTNIDRTTPNYDVRFQSLEDIKPAELAAINSLDIAGFIEPASEVGGDYYDVLCTDGVVTICIGDVTGNGLESGILMVMTQAAVRTLKEVPELDPVRFLDTLFLIPPM